MPEWSLKWTYLKAIKEPLRDPERAPWESLESLPGSPQEEGLKGPLLRPKKGTKKGGLERPLVLTPGALGGPGIL